MTLPKILAVFALVLFVTIGVAAIVKKTKKSTPIVKTSVKTASPIEVDLSEYELKPQKPVQVASAQIKGSPSVQSNKEKKIPHADRVEEFFNKGEPKFPIVETITYRSRVPWQKGRPAWLSDYASHYSTSRHFIARSLNGKPDYFKQNVAEGDRFNVLKKDKNIHFYLLIDTSLSKMWFYYIDQDTQERVLIKDYLVGLGRADPTSSSGSLTPLGKYTLGQKIAIYKPKMNGIHNGEKIEMIRVFGTRWIPFDKEISDTTGPAKGIGIHGVPWKINGKGELEEDCSSLGKRQSDGCIRLSTKDMEELFAIIITKPTLVELVTSFDQAKLPGVER